MLHFGKHEQFGIHWLNIQCSDITCVTILKLGIAWKVSDHLHDFHFPSGETGPSAHCIGWCVDFRTAIDAGNQMLIPLSSSL